MAAKIKRSVGVIIVVLVAALVSFGPRVLGYYQKQALTVQVCPEGTFSARLDKVETDPRGKVTGWLIRDDASAVRVEVQEDKVGAVSKDGMFCAKLLPAQTIYPVEIFFKLSGE
ncbi:MAG: hypothetical protein V1902_01730 [Candidatus Falkowbacteria bacterium]